MAIEAAWMSASNWEPMMPIPTNFSDMVPSFLA